MAANNAEEPRMGASQDKLSDSSAASSDANTITGDSSLTVGKLEYFKGAPETSTTPLIADRTALDQQDSLQAHTSSSAVASASLKAEELREPPSVSPNEDSHAIDPPSSPKTGKKGPGGWIKYTECQKAFILHHARDCSWDEVATKFKAQFGTDRPVDRVRLVHLRRYLVKTEQEQTLLNDATTYDWYTAVPAMIDAEVKEQTWDLGHCSEEQQAFLVYHAIKGVTYRRIVEVFNKQFGTAIDIDILDFLLLASRREGNEPNLLVAAAGYEWYKMYLPKRAPPGSKAPGSSSMGNEIETPEPDLGPGTLTSPKPESKARSKAKARRAFSDEHLSYLAWMSRRVRCKEPISEGFRTRFGNFPDEWKVTQQIKRFKRNPDWVDRLLDGVESYTWYQPDLMPWEVGYKGQEILRVRAEARRRLRMGVNRFAPPADGSPTATQPQVSVGPFDSLSPRSPPIRREDSDRELSVPGEDLEPSQTSATLDVSRPTSEALPNVFNAADSHHKTADTDADEALEFLLAKPVMTRSTRNATRVRPAAATPTCGKGDLRRREAYSARRLAFAPPSSTTYTSSVRGAAMPTKEAAINPAPTNDSRFAAVETAPPGLPEDFVEEGFEPISYGNPVSHTQQLLGGSTSQYHDSNYEPMALPPSHQNVQRRTPGGHQSASSRTSLSTQYFDPRIHGSAPNLHLATSGHAVETNRQTTTYPSPYQRAPSQYGLSSFISPYQHISSSAYETTSYVSSYGQQNNNPPHLPQHWEAGYEGRPGQAHARAQQQYRPAQYHQLSHQHNDLAQHHNQSRPQHPLQYRHPSNYGSRPSHVYGATEGQYQPAQHQPRRHYPHGLSLHDLSQFQPSSGMQQQRSSAHAGLNNVVRRQRTPRDAVDLGSVSQGSVRSASPDKAERNRNREFW